MSQESPQTTREGVGVIIADDGATSPHTTSASTSASASASISPSRRPRYIIEEYRA